MSRVIKFRAWDMTNKKMLLGEHIWIRIYPQTGKTSCENFPDIHIGERPNETTYDPRTDVEIMQSTGLKDRNGVEIFEGDLLQWNADEDAHYEVFYHDDECRFKCCRVHYHGSRCGGMIPDITSPNFHVIGNIYEHPHLLAQEKSPWVECEQTSGKF
jgi:uncharacterized phage protein (TIGR01671 family)